MSQRTTRGLTLLELLISVTILGMIFTAGAAMLHTALQTQAYGSGKKDLARQGAIAMDTMTGNVRRATWLLIPNAHRVSRDILAFSGTVNDDNDFYFGDPLFPRIDEDPDSDIDSNARAGIAAIDDDGDLLIDEFLVSTADDDEDLLADEDPVNGVDDDNDGNIDEDPSRELYGENAKPGIRMMDDDGDGSVDEGGGSLKRDDDEDGVEDEDGLNPIYYRYDAAQKRVRVTDTRTATTTTLIDHVTAFSAVYEAPERIQVNLTLTSDAGEVLTFSEFVHPRNTLQYNGRRVR